MFLVNKANLRVLLNIHYFQGLGLNAATYPA
jgi:hypothetical protein